jgi:hypothetical protein
MTAMNTSGAKGGSTGSSVPASSGWNRPTPRPDAPPRRRAPEGDAGVRAAFARLPETFTCRAVCDALGHGPGRGALDPTVESLTRPGALRIASRGAGRRATTDSKTGVDPFPAHGGARGRSPVHSSLSLRHSGTLRVHSEAFRAIPPGPRDIPTAGGMIPTAGGLIPPGICVSPLPVGMFASRPANIPGPWGMSQSASGNIRIPGGMTPLPVGIIPLALRMIPSRMRMFAAPGGMFPRFWGLRRAGWAAAPKRLQPASLDRLPGFHRGAPVAFDREDRPDRQEAAEAPPNNFRPQRVYRRRTAAGPYRSSLTSKACA